MPIDSRIEQCQHIKFNGVRCGSPAMRGALMCYFHLRPAKFNDIRVPEIMDFPTRQKLISQVVNAIITHEIDAKRAMVLFRLIKLSHHYEVQEKMLNVGTTLLSPAGDASLAPMAARRPEDAPTIAHHAGASESERRVVGTTSLESRVP
jgi:hypothetical protein